MVDYKIEERMPGADDYNMLRKSVGWNIYENEVINRALPNSLYCLCISINNEIIGMGRVIGDGGLTFYIQDIIIKPEYQRQGIGKAMMNHIMSYISRNANSNSVIGLMSAKGREQFYMKYGFMKRPSDTLGCGMTIPLE